MFIRKIGIRSNWNCGWKANRKFKRPSIVISEDANVCKASCRSVKNFHMGDFIIKQCVMAFNIWRRTRNGRRVFYFKREN